MFIDAVDVGFNAVKATTASGRETCFPSVIGLHRQRTYSLNTDNDFTIGVEGTTYDIGLTAITQSDYQTSRRDPRWVFSNSWHVLMCAALSRLHPELAGEIRLVTGLPLAHYGDIAGEMHEKLNGKEFFFSFDGKERYFKVASLLIVTQPFGTLCDYALGDTGMTLATVSASKLVGVVDIGGETLNILAADKLKEVAQWTAGDGLGLLNALDAIAHRLHEKHPGFSPKAREVALWVADGHYEYQGRQHEIAEIANSELDPLVRFIADRINEVFKEPGRLAGLCLTGGGAMILGDRIKSQLVDFPQVVMGDNFSNVRGYLKMGRRLWKG